MNCKKLQKFLALVLTLVMVLTVAAPIGANAADTGWTIQDDTEIFWVKTADSDISDEALKAQIQLFSSELAEKVTGTALDITFGEQSEAGENDIILVLDSSDGLAAEGYVIKATDTSIKISASDADGLFYGCRALIKQLLLNGYVTDETDAPQVAERAVSLDNGRKYYSVDWLKEFIREMSWANMNALALHFSEEMGLGIESKLYPWLNGRDGTLCTQAELDEDFDNRYLTQEEVVEIVEYAKLYHVEIIPSLDTPGHMNYIVKKFNEQCATEDFSFTYHGVTYIAEAGSEIGNYFHYDNKTSIVKGSRNADYSRGIDISNEVAVAFTKSLIEEYATLFGDLGCTKFDIGGDELLGWGSAIVSTSTASRWQQLDHWKAYAIEKTGDEDAVAYDAFLLYMNDLYDLVNGLGYTSVRMWNDDALRSTDTGWTGVVQLNTNIDIWYWTYHATSQPNIFYDYANAGYQLYNIVSDYNYYAMTTDYFSDSRTSFAQAYPEEIYNEWNPYIFYPADLSADWKHNPGQTNPNVLGGAFGIWSDNPTMKTEAEVMEDLIPLIRANAAKSWDPNANTTVSYETYVANWETYGSAPAGTVAAPEVYEPADLTALETAVDEYASVDGTLYTADSYAAYTAAVEAGKALLNADKPLQTDVDAAVAAITAAKAALVLKPTVDTSALEAAVAEYEQADRSLYTGETFIPYTVAVAEGQALLADDTATQAQLDAAVTAIEAAKAALELIEDGVECILGGSAKSSRVYVNKVATLTVSTDKSVATIGLVVVDENGNEIEATRYVLNTKITQRDVHTFIFTVTAADRGTHTYTVYAVLADGTLSADYIQATIEVR